MNRENIAVTLETLAQEMPEAKAVIVSRTDSSVTFQQRSTASPPGSCQPGSPGAIGFW